MDEQRHGANLILATAKMRSNVTEGFKQQQDNFTSTSGLTRLELVLRSDQGQNAALGCEGDEGSKPVHRLPDYC